MKLMLLLIALLPTLTGCTKYQSQRNTRGIKYISECLYKNIKGLDIEVSEETSEIPPFEFRHKKHDVTVSFNQINGVTNFFNVGVEGKSSKDEVNSIRDFMFTSITDDCKA